jgi:hypothetical protein
MGRMQRVAIGLLLASLVVAAGCGPSGSTASQTPSATPVPVATATAGAPASSSAVGQTDTPWGRIWDTLPRGFPAIPGSSPSETTGVPASATLVIPGDAARSTTTAMQAPLAAAGFRTEGLSGPLEDGSYVLDTVGAQAGCKVQLNAKPLGGLTVVTLLYGAACPHD